MTLLQDPLILTRQAPARTSGGSAQPGDDPLERNLEALRPAQGGAWTIGRRVRRKPRIDEPASERDEGRLGLDPRQWRAEAIMQAAAEAEMLIVRPLGIEKVRIDKRFGSRLPAANSSMSGAPLGIRTPPMSMSASALRVRKCTGGS